LKSTAFSDSFLLSATTPNCIRGYPVLFLSCAFVIFVVGFFLLDYVPAWHCWLANSAEKTHPPTQKTPQKSKPELHPGLPGVCDAPFSAGAWVSQGGVMNWYFERHLNAKRSRMNSKRTSLKQNRSRAITGERASRSFENRAETRDFDSVLLEVLQNVPVNLFFFSCARHLYSTAFTTARGRQVHFFHSARCAEGNKKRCRA